MKIVLSSYLEICLSQQVTFSLSNPSSSRNSPKISIYKVQPDIWTK